MEKYRNIEGLLLGFLDGFLEKSLEENPEVTVQGYLYGKVLERELGNANRVNIRMPEDLSLVYSDSLHENDPP